MNGILILNKPAGCTSFEAVRSVSRLFSREKAGHAGTLDPMATGVLPVLLGRATRLLQYLPESGKEYIAEISFGVGTDTGDFEGRPVRMSEILPDRGSWDQAVLNRTGRQMQVPPMYSAIKKDGKPLYELARKGMEIEREAREIEVTRLETLSFSPEAAKIAVSCSAGTYIRTLAEDLAADCGTFAHLTSLQRTAACGFTLADAVTPEELERAEDPSVFVRSPEIPFLNCPAVSLDGNLTRLFLNGFVFPAGRADAASLTGYVRIYHGERFLGIGTVDGERNLKKCWQAETA